ncbi:MAG: CDP-diacylglycerol--glycerol-3-phosphate 3-phosphatidyltransferase [Candidatus Auribacterota bacterium]|jgi:CDP-diacylglycerol--glycerol-3-phosphate 3-phosphatidyltransferase|nr:CDP-diacylglycerol--glycerol-3-phosphate 3-phosphatidyltransferase [Candidatus Auribacterota bacterium]
MNIANKLTVSRIFAAGVFVALLLAEFPLSNLIALVVFIYACITDWVDGKLARRLQVESDFGKLIDPLADKLLIISAFIAFIELPQVALPSWVVILIIGREFTITGLRLLAANKGIIIPAGWWGKNKTISQIVSILSILVYLTVIDLQTACAFMEIPLWAGAIYYYYVVFVVLVTVVLTVMSGYVYMKKNWHLISEY